MEPSTVVITGASSGLGQKTAEILARDPRWRVVLACRDAARADAARRIIERSAKHPVLVAPLELESLAAVRAFPAALDAIGVRTLGALVLNAGVQDIQSMRTTTDGFERTFAVNHLGHFLLTELLEERLATGARIAIVSSNTHDPATKTGMPAPHFQEPRVLATGTDEGADPVVAGRTRYTTSKLCNVYFARELARRCAAADDARVRSFRVVAFDPGMMPGTGLARDYGGLVRFAWSYLLPVLRLGSSNVNSVPLSATRLARLVTDEEVPWPSGAYISRGKLTLPSIEALDPQRARDLWSASEALVAAGPS
jgi:NAD(P)-dependent dehydrogenase (short-subunit alcohol dehydrogenase family)